MREQIRPDLKHSGEMSSQSLWNDCKVVLRGEIIVSCHNLKKKIKIKLNIINGKIMNIQKMAARKKIIYLKQKYYETENLLMLTNKKNKIKKIQFPK